MKTRYHAVPTAEGEVLSGDPVAPVSRFNGQGGIRTKWWWQDGPVDSCCFCCPLPTAIALLALKDLVYDGIVMAILRFPNFLAANHELLHKMESLEAKYEQNCAGERTGPSTMCKELAQKIRQAGDDVTLAVFMITFDTFLWTVCIFAGVVGIWAVFGRSAFAAKLYMKTWLPKLVLLFSYHMGIAVMAGKLVKNGGYDGMAGLVVLATLFFTIPLYCLACTYFYKVSWSYFTRLEMGSAAGAASSAARSGEIAPDVRLHATQQV